MKPSRLLLLGGALLALVAQGSAHAAQTSAPILVTEVVGPITPVTADQLADAVRRAEDERHQLLLVELDTPGGVDVSTREIVQSFLSARVPVVVFVSPQGARAASAGTMITLAAHVAVMAPGTTIGAATPVDLGGGEITDKIINDSAAFAVAVAQRRDRDVVFAEDSVRDGRSITASEALEVGAIDLIAVDRDELINLLEGREVDMGGSTVVLRTIAAPLDIYEPSWARKILASLADPNLAFLFISLGTLAVIYEVANPGMGLGGTVGAILLILGFFALSVLPVNMAGVALLLLAAGLFLAEFFVPGVGVMAAGGTIALIFSGLFLFEGSIGVSPGVFLPMAAVLGAAAALAGRMAWRARRRPPTMGESALVGRRTTVATAEGGSGQVLLDGAWWRVRSPETLLTPGQTVRVVSVEGLDLIVQPEEEETHDLR